MARAGAMLLAPAADGMHTLLKEGEENANTSRLSTHPTSAPELSEKVDASLMLHSFSGMRMTKSQSTGLASGRPMAESRFFGCGCVFVMTTRSVKRNTWKRSAPDT